MRVAPKIFLKALRATATRTATRRRYAHYSSVLDAPPPSPRSRSILGWCNGVTARRRRCRRLLRRRRDFLGVFLHIQNTFIEAHKSQLRTLEIYPLGIPYPQLPTVEQCTPTRQTTRTIDNAVSLCGSLL